MTILLLGGRGKTASRIAPLLQAANLPFLLASRSVSPASHYHQAYFDWTKDDSYDSPFTKAATEGMAPITAIYLVPPPIFDLAPPMIHFVDFARQRGVKRFVLLSASTIEKGGPAMGQVHEYLDSLDAIEYTILRPTWFMENFSHPGELQHSALQNESKIYSAAGDGKIPFISTHDVARVAFLALTNEKSYNTDYVLLGPELLTYDGVASILTSVIDRNITHVKLSETELAKWMESMELPTETAEMVVHRVSLWFQ
ncbi:agroclavine dehydrogenase [Trichoderma arundinaceum]|uniref:Agroclavine dehydrogenase n=1 Tax=Trichoderma arundinaceum TaxID=490622 RepID=A0A395NFI5_TRIAR|nr:agroclavine dehydrogenase [Trichoderma arundinaceum]